MIVSSEVREAICWAAGWQLAPVLCCAAQYGSRSQNKNVALLLLVIVPLVAGTWHFVLIQKRPGSHRRSLVIVLVTCAVGGIGVLSYAVIVTLLILSAGSHL